MSFHTTTAQIAANTSCDKQGCNAEATFDFYKPGPGAAMALGIILGDRREYEEQQRAEAIDAFELDGWTFWVGARTNYAYCADHKPSPTSRSTTRVNGEYITASCYHGKHRESCDQAMRATRWRKNYCKCDCHQEEGN